MSPIVHQLGIFTRGRYLNDTLEAVDREHNETSSVVSAVPHTWVTTQKVEACRGLCWNLTQGPGWDAASIDKKGSDIVDCYIIIIGCNPAQENP